MDLPVCPILYHMFYIYFTCFQQNITAGLSTSHGEYIHTCSRPAKDDLGLKVPSMYQIPCECGKVYTGQTGRSIEARRKEHMRHIPLEQPKRSVVAEHSTNIDFSSTSTLHKAAGYMDHLAKQATENQSNTRNLNRDDCFIFSCAQYPVINLLYNQKAGPGRAST
jgi:hypothetical protein